MLSYMFRSVLFTTCLYCDSNAFSRTYSCSLPFTNWLVLTRHDRDGWTRAWGTHWERRAGNNLLLRVPGREWGAVECWLFLLPPRRQFPSVTPAMQLREVTPSPVPMPWKDDYCFLALVLGVEFSDVCFAFVLLFYFCGEGISLTSYFLLYLLTFVFWVNFPYVCFAFKSSLFGLQYFELVFIFHLIAI